MKLRDIFIYAKAIAALIGAIITAILGTLPSAPQWLVLVGVVVTAIATYAVPNSAPGQDTTDS